MPPYFKTEPVRSQLHLERNRLVLTCMAEGSWPLEFKWIHNNTELTRFSLEYRWVDKLGNNEEKVMEKVSIVSEWLVNW